MMGEMDAKALENEMNKKALEDMRRILDAAKESIRMIEAAARLADWYLINDTSQGDLGVPDVKRAAGEIQVLIRSLNAEIEWLMGESGE